MLLLAKGFGEICEKIGIPSVLGYIITGIVAGPMVLKVAQPQDVQIFAQLGILFLLFITGFEQGNIRELMKDIKAIASVSMLGYFIPYAAAMAIGWFFGLTLNQLILLGLLVAATDSGITIKSIASVGKLGTRAGKIMVGVTVMDGLTGLIIFTLIMTYATLGTIDIAGIMHVLASIVAFLAIFIVMHKLVPFVVKYVEYMNVEQAEFSFAFAFVILLAITAEHFGLHGIIGAFLAGVILSDSPMGTTTFLRRISSISLAIFIPLFFIWGGLLLNFEYINPFSFAIVGGVLIANAVAAYLAGMLNNVGKEGSLLMSISMLPRGDINLVLASIAVTAVGRTGEPILTKEVGELFFSTTMLLVLLGAIITAVLLKIFIRKREEKGG